MEEDEVEGEDTMEWACAGEEDEEGQAEAQEAAAAVVRYRPSTEGSKGKGAAGPVDDEDKEGAEAPAESLQTLHQVRKTSGFVFVNGIDILIGSCT